MRASACREEQSRCPSPDRPQPGVAIPTCGTPPPPAPASTGSPEPNGASMPPTWLTVLAWTALAVAFASAAVILIDIYGRGHRQRHMPVMEAVWPITALYFGPVAVWGYHRFGRPASTRWLREHGLRHPPDKPGWAGVAVDVSHCGSGCTLGDIIAEFGVFALGATVAGAALWAEYISDYLLAVALGLVFQYFAIAPMRGLSFRKGIVA